MKHSFTPTFSKSYILTLLSWLSLGVLLVSTANAQLAVRLQMDKASYLLNEPVTATVSITNNAGREVVLKSSPSRPWLSFNVKSDGRTMPAVGKRRIKPVVIPVSKTVSKQVVLSSSYALSNLARFSCTASVNIAGVGGQGRLISSNRVSFAVATGKTVWSQRVGVPGSKSEIRDYKLIRFAGNKSPHLFAEISSVNRRKHIATVPLGKTLTFQDPSGELDKANNLHAVYQVSPEIYIHTVISIRGKIISAKYIKRSSGRPPRLVRQGDGSVYIAGGVPYDPEAAAVDKKKIHSSSERPRNTFQ